MASAIISSINSIGASIINSLTESTTTAPTTTAATTTAPTTTAPTTTAPTTTASTTTAPTTTAPVTTSPTTSSTSQVSSATSAAGTTSAGGTTGVTSATSATSVQSTSTVTGAVAITTPVTSLSTDANGSVATSVGTSTAQISVAGSTTYVYTTITDSSGATQTSAVALANAAVKSHTGAIVGGVVGGVGGLIVLAALLWFFCFRRKKSDKDFDDMMFDPARGNRHAAPGTTDLVDGSGPAVEPYYGGSPTQAASPQMSQYQATGGNIAPSLPPNPSYIGDLGAVGAGLGTGAALAPIVGAGAGRSDDGEGGNVRRGPSSASTLTSAGFAGRGAGNQYYGQPQDAYGMPVPVPSGPSSSSGANSSATTPSTAASRKQREAQQERMRTNNPDMPPNGAGGYTSGGPRSPSSPGGTSGPLEGPGSEVMVHQDGGRVELPPQYHSLPGERS